jgi:hypothetical protein
MRRKMVSRSVALSFAYSMAANYKAPSAIDLI